MRPSSCGSSSVRKPSWPRRARAVACEALRFFTSWLWKDDASLCLAVKAGVLLSDPVEHICPILFFPSHFIFKNLHCFFLAMIVFLILSN